MKSRLMLFVLLFTTALPAYAAHFYFLAPAQQYEIMPMLGDPEMQTEYYGTLEGYPNLYEISTTSPFMLTLQLSQSKEKQVLPFSLLVVRVVNEGEVLEIVKMQNPKDSWIPYWDYVLGTSLLKSEVLQMDLLPGQYRIEVSTPDNVGPYLLEVGHQSQAEGYFATWKRVVSVNFFFGNQVLFWFSSLFVAFHTFSAIFILWWWYRLGKKRQPASLYA